MILSLPFLRSNSIVLDSEAGTVINKQNDDNLLKPLLPQQKKFVLMRKKFQHMLHDQKEMVKELTFVCQLRQEMECLGMFEPVKEVNVIAAVHAQIQQLAHKASLNKFDAQLKAEFHEVFEPIAHAKDLPQNVFAKIKICDANQTIKTCSYQCPQKYQEAWKALIEDHLTAGHIQPLSSPYASPVFIIAKADPTIPP